MLEIGAATGDTMIYAKKHAYANTIHGIELMKIDNSNQTSNEFQSFTIGNVEDMDFDFEVNSLDVIILGDVLEHLINPYDLVKKLTIYLKEDGVVIASIPNIREWNVMKTIFFKGDFKYENAGILDSTHLRFFTRKNINELFENNGYNIVAIKSKNYNQIKRYLYRLRLLKVSLYYFFNEFVTEQYYVVAKKQC